MGNKKWVGKRKANHMFIIRCTHAHCLICHQKHLPMKRLIFLPLFVCVVLLANTLPAQVTPRKADLEEFESIQQIKEPYGLSIDAKPKEGVPKGTLKKYVWESKHIYPGTSRNYWVYIPEQYDPSKPACLLIVQDGELYLNGVAWTPGISPTVTLDNLIHQEEIPVTIGLFINPGDKGPGGPYWGGTDNRSFEYDAVTDLYSRFLTEEMIPELEKQYNIAKGPAGRILIGYSSGAICAFNAA